MPTTLADIQKKYGDSVYPLYKEQMHEPYMENEPVNNNERKRVVEAKKLFKKYKTIKKVSSLIHDTGNNTKKLIYADLTKMPKRVSAGYGGVILYDEVNDKVQCSECGEWYGQLVRHIAGKHTGHNMTMTEYRNKHGLLKSASLTSLSLSRQRSATMKERRKTMKYQSNGSQMNSLTSDTRSKIVKNFTTKTQFKNKKGLCDAQMAARLMVVKEQSNDKKISSGNIHKYDIHLYDHLKHKYGTVGSACKALKIDVTGKGNHPKKYEDAKIIAQLRNWVIVNKKVPSSGSKNWPKDLPGDDIYYRYFGSWRRAKMMAGLDQLLEEVK